jgi:hypothetical protein
LKIYILIKTIFLQILFLISLFGCFWLAEKRLKVRPCDGRTNGDGRSLPRSPVLALHVDSRCVRMDRIAPSAVTLLFALG